MHKKSHGIVVWCSHIGRTGPWYLDDQILGYRTGRLGFHRGLFELAVLMIIPEGILQGTTNQRVFLNIITEMIAGYAWSGKPIADPMVECYGYNAVNHGTGLAQDLKLRQYMVSYFLVASHDPGPIFRNPSARAILQPGIC